MEKTKEVLHTQASNGEIELKAMEGEIWQRFSPAIGSGVFVPLMTFESAPITGKYTKKQFAELICKAVNYYNNNKLPFDLATKVIEGSKAMQEERQRLIDSNRELLAALEWFIESASHKERQMPAFKRSEAAYSNAKNITDAKD